MKILNLIKVFRIIKIILKHHKNYFKIVFLVDLLKISFKVRVQVHFNNFKAIIFNLKIFLVKIYNLPAHNHFKMLINSISLDRKKKQAIKKIFSLASQFKTHNLILMSNIINLARHLNKLSLQIYNSLLRKINKIKIQLILLDLLIKTNKIQVQYKIKLTLVLTQLQAFK